MRNEVSGVSFELVDGTRYYLPHENDFAEQRCRFWAECFEADLAREPRPEPHPYYKALADAKDRSAAARHFWPVWEPGSEQPFFCPYDVNALILEGRFIDIPFG